MECKPDDDEDLEEKPSQDHSADVGLQRDVKEKLTNQNQASTHNPFHAVQKCIPYNKKKMSMNNGGTVKTTVYVSRISRPAYKPGQLLMEKIS